MIYLTFAFKELYFDTSFNLAKFLVEQITYHLMIIFLTFKMTV